MGRLPEVRQRRRVCAAAGAGARRRVCPRKAAPQLGCGLGVLRTVVFHVSDVWGSPLPGAGLRSWDTGPLLVREKRWVVRSRPIRGCGSRCEVCSEAMSDPQRLVYHFPCRSCSASFWFFSEENFACVALDWVCLWWRRVQHLPTWNPRGFSLLMVREVPLCACSLLYN